MSSRVFLPKEDDEPEPTTVLLINDFDMDDFVEILAGGLDDYATYCQYPNDDLVDYLRQWIKEYDDRGRGEEPSHYRPAATS